MLDMETQPTTASVRNGILQAAAVIVLIVLGVAVLYGVCVGIDGAWTTLVNAPAR